MVRSPAVDDTESESYCWRVALAKSCRGAKWSLERMDNINNKYNTAVKSSYFCVNKEQVLSKYCYAHSCKALLFIYASLLGK